ncbi:response regulator [Pseudoroseomonas wenyumeiae]|uniref:Response regulator n=3 Tax=Teichococcus wenyumeiae TaxID=2478470 RepID=A0A3A9JM26_9PROT|nr:DNA-binding response regulator [Pseudoroseomonas wenyumeiae]RMI25944.1 response regulator [Pseudoroseomonas wenyumeiae]
MQTNRYDFGMDRMTADPAAVPPPCPDGLLQDGRVPLVLVEDDHALADTLARALERDGFCVEVAGTLAAARAADLSTARIVLVDMELPDGNGLAIVRELAGRRDRGILMLSGRTTEPERILGLELGADDFLTKPFSMREMTARIRAVLRRLEEPDQAGDETVEAVGVTLDPSRQRIVAPDGTEQRLTGAEAGLLGLMLTAPDRVAEREVVAQQVLGYALQPQQRGVDQFASSLRQKLSSASNGRIQITAVRGRGYRLVW